MTVEEAIEAFEHQIAFARALQGDKNPSVGYMMMAIEALREKQERDNPKPLTLDDIKTYIVQERPMFIVCDKQRYWDFADEIYNGGKTIHFDMGTSLNVEKLGKTWFAYRYELEGSDNDA